MSRLESLLRWLGASDETICRLLGCDCEEYWDVEARHLRFDDTYRECERCGRTDPPSYW